MMHVKPCAEVQEQLEAYYDGELTVDEQVAIQVHLGECVACTLVAGEMTDLTGALRESAARQQLPVEALGISANVLERLKVEEQFSFGAQVKSLFQDMHLVWAGLGATVATLICVIGSASVLHAASQERPESLAALISVLANPGSNRNPVALDNEMMMPRLADSPMSGHDVQDAAFALAAVVTREGRIQNLEVLAAEYATTIKAKPEVVLAMLNDAARARFEPAQARVPVCRFDSQDCGTPVAVNVVWLVTTTTVKGNSDADVILVRQPWVAAAPLEPAPQPQQPDEDAQPAVNESQPAPPPASTVVA